MPNKVWDEITYQFPNGSTIEVWEWIINFIQYFIMDVITHPWYFFFTDPEWRSSLIDSSNFYNKFGHENPRYVYACFGRNTVYFKGHYFPNIFFLLTYLCMKTTWGLAHWGWDKMAAISQMTFSDGFSWIRIYKLCFRFHRSLFLRFKLTIFHHWFG